MIEQESSAYFTTTLMSRLRLLEERYQQLRENMELLNENMIGEYKQLKKDTKSIEGDIKEIKKDVYEIKNAIDHIVKEIVLFARKDTVKILEKYINMWNPMNFVTEDEVIRIIKEESQKTKKPIIPKKDGRKK